MSTISPKDMFVFSEYPYDKYADKQQVIYVGITDFLAYNKDVVQFVKFQNRVYKRICTDVIPMDMAGHISCVQKYGVINSTSEKAIEIQ